MSKLGFDKFINKKSAAKVKEEHRQEKRKSKAALRAAGDEYRRQKLEKQRGGNLTSQEDENFRGGKSYRERNADTRNTPKDDSRPRQRTPQRAPDGRFTKSENRANNRSGREPGTGRSSNDSKHNTNSKNTWNTAGEDHGYKGYKQSSRSHQAQYNRDYRDKSHNQETDDKYGKRDKYAGKQSRYDDSRQSNQEVRPLGKKSTETSNETMPLNKYIAHAGICGRREAAELVKLGQVQVNGDIVFEPATKISEKDTVKLKGKKLTLQVKNFYFLLNKPKDHITTTKDDKGRKTVLDLFKDMDIKHLYPVGRLDRNTTGVLLITNDGELAQQLTHPSFEVKKIYEATLDRPVAKKDLEAIATGITLEDGDIRADQVGYPDSKNKAVIGIEIHSGKNRIVRRIFEHLGYEVKKLDRVMFAGLTKKNVERGKWRYLSEKEVRVLKYMNAGGTKKALKAAAEQAEQSSDETPVKKSKRTRIPVTTEKPEAKKGDRLGTLRKKISGPGEKPVRKKTKSGTSGIGKTTRREKN